MVAGTGTVVTVGSGVGLDDEDEQDAVKPELVTSKTVPCLLEPPPLAVPNRLPLASTTSPAVG